MSTPNEEKKTLISKLQNWGRFFEILIAASLAGMLLVYSSGLGNFVSFLIIALLVAIFVGSYLRAMNYAVEAKRKAKEIEDDECRRLKSETDLAAELKYKVTNARIRTLSAAGVPEDITEALYFQTGDPAMPEKEFLTKLALDPDSGVGTERVNEFREKILRYTKDEPRPAPPSLSGKLPVPKPDLALL